MTTRLTLRVYFDGDRKLGPGKLALLEAIRNHGSILAAARTLKMSYRRARLLVEELNTMFAEPLVNAKSTGASLTPTGELIVSLYRTAEEKARAQVGLNSKRSSSSRLAAASSVIGTSIPSPFAVFRLTIISNFVACSIGMSPASRLEDCPRTRRRADKSRGSRRHRQRTAYQS